MKRSISQTAPALHRVAAAALAAAACAPLAALAQSEGAGLQSITITGRQGATQVAGITGFGDVPLSRLPLSASVISVSQLQDAGISSLGDLTRLNASATDAYNPPGYWSQLAVRGFIVDNRFNYRRDGLPINAETIIPLANKQALELLQGTSGLQAGTSAPGGLVNLVVKRPLAKPVMSAKLGITQGDQISLEADVGHRAGADGAIGWRVNASATRLGTQTRNTRGGQASAAVAGEVRLSPATMLEAEAEWSRHSQPSVPGFSLAGARLPAASSVDPRINLNNQSWSLPVVFKGQTGSVRLTHEVSTLLQIQAQLMRQQLTTDDRVAFPFGCSAADDYSRYCADGTFDLYDFRSEGERRTSDAAELSFSGKAVAGGAQHRYKAGVLSTRFQSRLNRQAYNWVGIGTIDGLAALPADPTLTDENTNRSERSNEFFVQDNMQLGLIGIWGGLRHTRLHRESVRTDGSRATAYSQGLTTPWLALSMTLLPSALAYVSWGQGVESEVAPNRSRYSNAGQALPALKSQQWELGWKGRSDNLDARLAAFSIQRPLWSDIGLCGSAANSCVRQADGTAQHRGVEAEAEWRFGPYALRGSATQLKARRAGAQDPRLNGLQPTNVPERNIKLQGAYNSIVFPGLAYIGFFTHEGARQVLPDNSTPTPGWNRVDLGLRYAQRLQGTQLTWRLGVDNVANKRAWKEAPYQYEHAYLYPLAPRTAHASVQMRL
jgi:iron complex outermembrane recepter protein